VEESKSTGATSLRSRASERSGNEAIGFDAMFYLPTKLKKISAQFCIRPANKMGGHDVVQLIGANPGEAADVAVQKIIYNRFKRISRR
jgi:hypothetical protein